MRIPLERGSGVPLYQQIELYLQQSITSGALPPATKLPSARQLAFDLGVGRITIDNAYAALETAGLVERRAGSGTFVLPPDAAGPLPEGYDRRWPLWQLETLESASIVRADVAARPSSGQSQPGAITFNGFGDPRLFQVADFYRSVKHVMRRDGSAALTWDDRRGYAPLRTTIAHVLANQGLHVHADTVLITNGSQQALALVAQVLLKAGDTVLVESPTYELALELFRAQGLRLVGCATDADGMQVEQLERLLQQHHPRLIYINPTFQNPTGTCLGAVRRRQLIALADRYNIPILEDDFAGELRYDGRAQPALKALDPGGRVIYVGTFSKLLMPGLRIGFLVAEGPVYPLLTRQKQLLDLLTSTLTQRALDSYVTVGRYQTHVRRLCRVYRHRRDAMLDAITRYMPAETQAVAPQGGLYLWLGLPNGLPAAGLLPYAAEEGVQFTAGGRLFPEPDELDAVPAA